MIRAATLDDLPALMRLAGEMHRESRYHAWGFDEGKVARLFVALIGNPDAFAMVATDDAGQVAGALIATIYEPYFTSRKAAQDYGLFIDPDHRGGLKAARLVKAYLAWAERNDAIAGEIGVTTGVHPEQTGRFLQCMGMRPTGWLYTMEFDQCV